MSNSPDIGLPQFEDWHKPKVALMAGTIASCKFTMSDFDKENEVRISNAEKVDYIRERLRGANVDLLTPFPYDEVYAGDGHACLAGQFLADLRIQLLQRMIDEEEGDPVVLGEFKIKNIVWFAKYRERVRFHNASVVFHPGNEETRYDRPTRH